MVVLSGRSPKTAARRRCSAAARTTTTMVLWVAMLLLLLCRASVEASAPVPDDGADAVDIDVDVDGDDDDDVDDSKQKIYEPDHGSYRFVHKTIIIPHDDKKFRGGEDAASTTDTMLVVADGVGGWAKRGVNPGLYSRKLTELVTSGYDAIGPKDRELVDLKKLVHEANHAAAALHLGSATCTTVRLMDASTLETLNIGDSGYSIHRRYNRGANRYNGNNQGADGTEKDASVRNPLKAVYVSVPGQKGFNFPYQLGGQHGDQVDDEGVADGPRRHQLRPKDIVVVVSDGVIDNMAPILYHDCLQRFQYWSNDYEDDPDVDASGLADGDVASLSAAADCIARKAYFLGKDPNHFGPFGRSAQRYGKKYVGGKHDDITVTVAQVALGGDALGRTASRDPHKSESVFVYKESDGPIPPEDDLPTRDEILSAVAGRPVEAEL